MILTFCVLVSQNVVYYTWTPEGCYQGLNKTKCIKLLAKYRVKPDIQQMAALLLFLGLERYTPKYQQWLPLDGKIIGFFPSTCLFSVFPIMNVCITF